MRSDRTAARFDRETWSRRANEIRARVPVSSVVRRVVPLKKAGAGELVGLCPFHNEATPSFTVTDKKGFAHCFGCGWHGDALAFVMSRQGLDFRAAVELLESENGLAHLALARPAPPPVNVEQREDLNKQKQVARMWGRGLAIKAGDPVDRYLRGRGLLPPGEWLEGASTAHGGWGEALRFDPACWHGLERRELPAMLAPMRRAGELRAVHRTYLKVTGAGVTKAGTERDKAMFGDARGCLMLLGPLADRMVGGEGIETTFAAMQLFRRSGLAFGARANMANADLPIDVADFIYAADRNRSHSDPARSRVGEAAARKGAELNAAGRRVQVKIPALPGDGLGDFNDVLQLQLRRARGEAA